MKRGDKAHRGPTKANKKLVTFHLTAEEHSRLVALAEVNRRSAAQQAAWLVVNGLPAAPLPSNGWENP